MKLEELRVLRKGLILPLYVTNPICGNIDAANLRIEFLMSRADLTENIN